jgi:hypothetical protein
MKSSQQVATGLAAVLMLGVLLAMPVQYHHAAHLSASQPVQGLLAANLSRVSAELPQDQVRDLTYN